MFQDLFLFELHSIWFCFHRFLIKRSVKFRHSGIRFVSTYFLFMQFENAMKAYVDHAVEKQRKKPRRAFSDVGSQKRATPSPATKFHSNGTDPSNKFVQGSGGTQNGGIGSNKSENEIDVLEKKRDTPPPEKRKLVSDAEITQVIFLPRNFSFFIHVFVSKHFLVNSMSFIRVWTFFHLLSDFQDSCWVQYHASTTAACVNRCHRRRFFAPLEWKVRIYLCIYSWGWRVISFLYQFLP